MDIGGQYPSLTTFPLNELVPIDLNYANIRQF